MRIGLMPILFAASGAWAGTVATYGMTDSNAAATAVGTLRSDVRVSYASSQVAVPFSLIFGASEGVELGIGSGLLLGSGLDGRFAALLGSISPWVKFCFPLNQETQFAVLGGLSASTQGGPSTFGIELILSRALGFGSIDLNIGYGNDSGLQSSLWHANLTGTWVLSEQWSLVGEVFLHHFFGRGTQLGQRLGVLLTLGPAVAIDASFALSQDLPAGGIGYSPQLGALITF